MSGSSSPLSVRNDHPVPDPILHILRTVDRVRAYIRTGSRDNADYLVTFSMTTPWGGTMAV